MTEVFNTVFEVSLRILCILNVVETPISLEQILCLDFFSIYGKDFGYCEFNLHGDNNFKYTEIASHRFLIKKGLQNLVLQRYIDVTFNSSGIFYGISTKGTEFQQKMNNNYSIELSNILKDLISVMGNKSDIELLNMLKSAVNEIGGKK